MVVLREIFVKRNRYKTIRLKYLHGSAFYCCFFIWYLVHSYKGISVFGVLFVCLLFKKLHCIPFFLSDRTEENSSCWPAVTFLMCSLNSFLKGFQGPHSEQQFCVSTLVAGCCARASRSAQEGGWAQQVVCGSPFSKTRSRRQNQKYCHKGEIMVLCHK